MPANCSAKEISIPLKDDLAKVHSILTNFGIDHALIGGMALGFLGVHRATADIDFLVPEKHCANLKTALLSEGFIIFHESENVIQFTGFVGVDILVAKRPVSQKMIGRAPKIPNIGLKCLLPEDIIGLKIQAYKNNPKRELQDKADIVSLMRNYPNLNLVEVELYAAAFGEEQEIQKLWKNK